VDLVELIKAAAVVGAGGAGFPTHVKAAARAEILIANGAECEPLLVTDQWTVISHAKLIAEGMRALGNRVGAKRLIFGVKSHYTDVIQAMTPFLDGEYPIEIGLIGDFYPAGDEQVLVHELTGRVVPEGGIPLDVGVVVSNVATLANIRRSIDGQPVIRKEVTVTGLVRNPGVYEVPIGISTAEVVAAAGGVTDENVAIIEGGPMMGMLIEDWSKPVTKTTGAFLVLPADNEVVITRRRPHAATFRQALAVCCQCRMCTDQCSRFLLGHRIAPHLAMRALLAGGAYDLDGVDAEGRRFGQPSGDDIPFEVRAMGYLCSQCGICEVWSCPLGLSPRYVFGDYKAGMIARKQPNPLKNRPETALEQQAWLRLPKPRLVERLGLKDYLLPYKGTTVPVADPWEVNIRLKQHVGAPAIPIVKVGQAVSAGQCIAEIPTGALGARVHASMTGTVAAITDQHIKIVRQGV